VPTPLLYYAFTANAGTTEADLSGSSPAYNGTLANANLRVPAYCDGSVSPYLSLTSSTATTAVVGPSVKATTSFSISFWMNPGTTPSGVLADITDKNGSGAATMTDRQIYYKTDVSPAVLAFGARFGSGNGGLGTPTICTAAAPASGSWHHILATGDVNGVLTLYVDGGQACTVTGTGGYAPGGGSAGGFWSFGAESTLANNWPGSQTTGFVGGLDETAVYGTALSSTDVSTVYAAGH
jgi:hypothetical protein